MTQLLVSVRDVQEAQVALAAGAHLIDIKEPDRGALGAADEATIRSIVAAVQGRTPTSAALGEWNAAGMLPEDLGGPLTFAKVGLAGAARFRDWPRRWIKVLASLPASVRPVAVAYADWQAAQAPPPEEVLAQANGAGCQAVLIDTFDKRGGGLCEHMSLQQVARFIEQARSRNLICVLAGSLTATDFGALLPLEPDYLGVRGAACESGRRSQLSEQRLSELVRLVCATPVA